VNSSFGQPPQGRAGTLKSIRGDQQKIYGTITLVKEGIKGWLGGSPKSRFVKFFFPQ
jgi:hypothetical protein